MSARGVGRCLTDCLDRPTDCLADQLTALLSSRLSYLLTDWLTVFVSDCQVGRVMAFLNEREGRWSLRGYRVKARQVHHARPFVGVFKSQVLSDLVNFWR